MTPLVRGRWGRELRGWLQDGLRRLIGESLVFCGHLLAVSHGQRIRTFARSQDRLRSSYEITPATPVQGWGPPIQDAIERWAKSQAKEIHFVETSGTTAKPKRLAYPKRRVLSVQWSFVESFCRLYAATPTLQRHSLYVFAATDDDDSLTGAVMEDQAAPGYLAALQAPYRVHGLAALRELQEDYRDDAVRLWVLALSNPGVLYATNPSTLSTFLDRVEADWDEATRLIRAWVEKPRAFSPEVHRIAARVWSAGAGARLEAIATSPHPLPLTTWAPAAQLVVCWDGGYVTPFLERLDRHLEPGRHERVPMYSMSTETLETLPHYPSPGQHAFLPVAPGVLYELLPEACPDDPAHLLIPEQAEPGEAYTLVISDRYGLRRYQTGDLFECRRVVDGLPDLRFLRRRDLEHSFTGEKLTATQVQDTFRSLRAKRPDLSDLYLTLVPAVSPASAVPGYRLIILTDEPVPDDGLSIEVDALLGAVNPEYAHKRKSGRLAPIQTRQEAPKDFARRVSGGEAWESQFKFMPLYRRPL